jgi:hypothetical protein
MALLLTDIDDYLTTAGVTTPEIFRGYQPEDPNRCVVIYETMGFAPVQRMGSSPGTALAERPEVQIVARSTSYPTARNDAEDCFKALDGLYERTINGTRYLYVEAMQSPFFLDRDDLNRVRVACNYRIVKDLTA